MYLDENYYPIPRPILIPLERIFIPPNQKSSMSKARFQELSKIPMNEINENFIIIREYRGYYIPLYGQEAIQMAKYKRAKTVSGIVWTEEERKRTAYHEAGHGIVALIKNHSDAIYVSIRPEGDTLGRCRRYGGISCATQNHFLQLYLSTNDKHDRRKAIETYRGECFYALGGFVAQFIYEQVPDSEYDSYFEFMIDFMSDDFIDVDELYWDVMKDVLSVSYGSFLMGQINKTVRFLRKNWNYVDRLAKGLLEYETLEEGRILDIVFADSTPSQ